MGIEIERKFLVRSDDWRTAADAGVRMRQGYLSRGGPASIRVRVEGQRANLNIKSAEMGMQRQEYEYDIPTLEAEEMLDRLCLRPIIEKTRYTLQHAGHTWEIDVFEGENAGLVVAELELEHPDEPFESPPWLGEEVTDDKRYYNVSLVDHPYRDW